MPVIIEPRDRDRWLHPDPADAGLLVPSTAGLEVDPVSRAVNDPSNEGPGLVEPVAGD